MNTKFRLIITIVIFLSALTLSAQESGNSTKGLKTNLYPLKFNPILVEYLWGGNKLKTVLEKEIPSDKTGESWEISSLNNNLSIVADGSLKGKNIEELIEIYKGDLVGAKVYNRFGSKFPLLIKFLDANDYLAIQVHPDDKLAAARHNSFGKTEMWYIMDNEPGATLYTGFNRKTDRTTYLKYLQEDRVEELLNKEKVTPGDVFFIPAGRVHAIGKGMLVAEIQQTSNITYRLYDWHRKDTSGKEREMHTDLSLDAIDYNYYSNLKNNYHLEPNKITNVVDDQYFFTSILQFNQLIQKNYDSIQSFVIYICVEGQFSLTYPDGKLSINKGETILIPASLKKLELIPQGKAKILEVYIR